MMVSSTTALSAPFEVLAEARDPNGDGWAVVIGFRDRDGREKREPVGRARLASGGAEVRAALADTGLEISIGKGKAERFANTLARAKVSRRMVLAEATGWCGDAFVMPHQTVGRPGGEAVLFTEAPPIGSVRDLAGLRVPAIGLSKSPGRQGAGPHAPQTRSSTGSHRFPLDLGQPGTARRQ